MRTVTITLKVKTILKVNDNTEVSEIVDELDYHFSDTTGKADVEDSEILDYEVTDSK